MACLLLIVKFFGGLILLFALGWLVAHLLKLDNHIKKTK